MSYQAFTPTSTFALGGLAMNTSKWNVAHRYEKKRLLWAINGLAGLSIFFFGYDQVRPLGLFDRRKYHVLNEAEGMMGGVNNAYDYYHTTMKFGHRDPQTGSPIVTNSLLQGGIVRHCSLSSASMLTVRARYLSTISALWSAA
jgi:hypothetical protein